MNLFDVVSQYFWLICIMLTVINWMSFRKRAQKYIEENPELKEGYEELFRGYLRWVSMPWLVMGFGCTVGGVPSVWHYFRPRDENPFVLAWFACIFVLWLYGTYWLFLRNGAEKLATHPGAIKFSYGLECKDITNPNLIKLLWLLALAGGVVGVALMWTSDIPVPNIR